MKAQAEIVIVLAVIILMVFVVGFALQIGLKAPDITNLASVFRDEVSKRLYDGSLGVVKTVSAQGGFLDPKQNVVEFSGNSVPYWQVCQNKFIPSLADIRKNIKAGIEKFVNGLEIKDFQGKQAYISLKNSDVIIRNQDILVTLTLETKLAGYELDPVYEIRIPANLAELYAFASDFVEDNSVNRHLERAIIYSFFSADEKAFPTAGALTRCGDSIFRTWDDLKGAAEKIIRYSLGNIVFWNSSSEQSKYYIQNINNGKTYPEIGIKFSSSKLTKENFQPSINPVSIINSKTIHLFVPECVKNYAIGYTLNSPIVTSVGSQDYSFSFAVLPFIDNNKIGKCSLQENLSYADDPCLEGKCDASVSVVDQNNQPLPGTTVSFGICPIGKTGPNGQAKGKVPCGISELNVYNPAYEYFNEITNSKGLLEKTVLLKKIPTINVHFYKGDYNREFVELVGARFPTENVEIKTYPTSADTIIAIFRSKDGQQSKEFMLSNIDFNGSTISSQLVDYLPPNNYTVEIQTSKKGQLLYEVCESKLLGLIEDCSTESADVVFIGKVLYNFNVDETTKDIYITSLIPGENIVNGGKVDWDYTSAIPNFDSCLQVISTKKPVESCMFELPRIRAHG